MRKIVFVLFFVITSITLNAQLPERLSFSTSIGTGISMNPPTSTPFTWQVLGHYEINNRFSAGIGSGISFYENSLLVTEFAEKLNHNSISLKIGFIY